MLTSIKAEMVKTLQSKNLVLQADLDGRCSSRTVIYRTCRCVATWLNLNVFEFQY